MQVSPLVPVALSLGVAVVAVAACAGRQRPDGASGGAGRAGGAGGGGGPGLSPLAAEAIRGVADQGLRDLLRDHWEWLMETSPVWATTLGDHRFDDRLEDLSAAGVAANRARARELRARADKLPRASLAREDRITLDLLIGELSARIATEVCEEHLWAVSASVNPVASLNVLPEMHTVATPADGDHLAARYRAMPRLVDDAIANLREGLRRGLVAEKETARRALELVDCQLATPLEKWVLLEPAAAAAARKSWPAADRARVAADLRRAVREQVLPAFRRYRAALADEVLPRARGPEAAGVSHLPRGAACYAAHILEHTGLALEPEPIHRTGLDEIARIDRELVALAPRALGGAIPRGPGTPLERVLRTLRTDRELYFHSGEEIVSAATQLLGAARARIPDFFGRRPRAECVVAVIPDYEAPFTSIAYYREPHFDGSKPGQYFINTFKPEVRPRFELAALTFHESIPGHHLQIALSQEQSALPAWRRFAGPTAFVEGWALYTERLADQMGLYRSDLDRIGMLSYDAWRAARLVVDTGIHAKGWTRAQAEAYMRAHTALTEENIRNEVDRYIGWPAQALAYKVGQLEILRIRREAEAALGARFDIKAFHDVVLGSGAVSLSVLADNVAAWTAERKARPATR